MSAWRIGSEIPGGQRVQTVRLNVPASALGGAEADEAVSVDATIETPAEEAKRTAAERAKQAADTYTKWIPGEVLAIYLALTTAFRSELTGDKGFTPNAGWILIAGIALAALLVLLAGIAGNLTATDAAAKKGSAEIVGLMVLGSFAFTFWSLCAPGSWWATQGWNQGVLAAVSFAISIVFALVADIAAALLKPS